jgi:hypothetical protein
MGYVLLNKNTILKGIIVVKNEKTTLLTTFFGGMKKITRRLTVKNGIV